MNGEAEVLDLPPFNMLDDVCGWWFCRVTRQAKTTAYKQIGEMLAHTYPKPYMLDAEP